ncbi:MAG: bacteriohopanetetrol glucosamine biosynthesis glycosyltransferase HpnI [Sphingomonas oligoaromativorans]
MPGFISMALAFVAMTGVAYTLAATALAGRWRPQGAAQAPAGAPSVTMLKPLHGPEPMLEAKLRGFLDQDYPAPVDMVCGVSRADDPAAKAARAVGATLVVDGSRHGSNAKVSNLINMAPQAKGDIIILSDSDMAVPRDYAARIAAEMARPGVGIVTLLYAGRGDGGGWSRLAAAGISWGFLPSVMVGLATGMAHPCMGSTIAIRRETLDAIGGFERFKDLLADDHAIGAAVRETGLAVVVPPMIVAHGSTEASLAELVAHELRWNATVRMLDPAGYAGSVVTYPTAFALLAVAMGAGWWVLAAALLSRLALAARIDYIAGERTAPLWWLPARDLLSFGLYVGAFFTRRVDWRGQRLHMADDGRMTAETETRYP